MIYINIETGELVNDSTQLHREEKNGKNNNQVYTEYNVITKKPYTGHQGMDLMDLGKKREYKSHEWGTFLTWKKLGRKIIKGEKGTTCFHPGHKKTGVIDKDGKEVMKPVRKYFKVFNLEQTEPIKTKEQD
jgi:antirestriction protein ArdC